MKVAVVGAGAIGGYLGAKLALAGEAVTFIARGRNLEAIRAGGMKLVLEDGSEHIAAAVKAFESPAQAGAQDVILLTVKAHQVAALAPQLQAMYGAGHGGRDHAERHPLVVLPRPRRGARRTPGHLGRSGRNHRAAASTRAASSDRSSTRRRSSSHRVSCRSWKAIASRWASWTAATTPRVEAIAQALIRSGLKAPIVARHPQRDLAQAVGQPELQSDQRADPCDPGGHLPVPAHPRASRRP